MKRRHVCSHAFSLIEVVLAVGIISFALVGILGLFPVAMNSAKESQQETQATFIAQEIFAGLMAPSPFLPDDPSKEVDMTAKLPTIDFDEAGIVLNGISGSSNSPSSGKAVYSVNITSTTQPSGLIHVQVEISTPAGASAANQKTYTFVTLVNP